MSQENGDSYSELRAEVAALQQQLDALAAKQARPIVDAGTPSRWRWSKKVMVVLLPAVALLATSGLLYGQGEALFINAKGWVGIGTSEPQAPLDVKGTQEGILPAMAASVHAAKTGTDPARAFALTTSEKLADSPFALDVRLVGGRVDPKGYKTDKDLNKMDKDGNTLDKDGYKIGKDGKRIKNQTGVEEKGGEPVCVGGYKIDKEGKRIKNQTGAEECVGEGWKDIATRSVIFQTTDWNSDDGGNILFQPSTGKVGIGISRSDPAPKEKLEVSGSVKVTDKILVGDTDVMVAIKALQTRVGTLEPERIVLTDPVYKGSGLHQFFVNKGPRAFFYPSEGRVAFFGKIYSGQNKIEGDYVELFTLPQKYRPSEQIDIPWNNKAAPNVKYFIVVNVEGIVGILCSQKPLIFDKTRGESFIFSYEVK